MVTTLYLIRHGETEGSEIKRYKGSIDVPMSEKGIEQMKGTSVFIQNMIQDAGYSRLRRPAEAGTQDIFSSCIVHRASSKLSAIYCSPLSRALKSAEIIAESNGLKPIVIEDLRERSFGIWEGMTFTEIKENYPQEFEAWAGNPLRYSPIDGESTIEVRERVIRVLNEIIGRHNPPHPNPLPQGERGYKNSPSLDGRGRGGGWNKAFSEQSLYSENITIVAHGGVNRIILCHIMGIPLENIFRIEQDFAAVNIIEFWEKYPVVKLINGQASLEYKW
ncbi:MAG: histidine phosphatase family protein [Thermodesulfovibrionales bacterium]|nr:histidine phosphatase family protein [Thermodesulfovibrionales bacterium]